MAILEERLGRSSLEEALWAPLPAEKEKKVFVGTSNRSL
jgi:hypothetical protein